MTWNRASTTFVGASAHHTAGTNNYSQGEVPWILRGIYTYHVQGQHWGDVVGGHAYHFNKELFGVSVLGNFDTGQPSSAAVDTVSRVIAWKFTEHGIDPHGAFQRHGDNPNGQWFPTIVGHRDAGSTSCPGQNLYELLPYIRNHINDYKPHGGGAIGAKFDASGSRGGPPGWPITEEIKGLRNGSAFQRFQDVQVHWSAATGAWPTKNGSGPQNAWAAQVWENGRLGYPTRDKQTTSDGQRQWFQGGFIVLRR